MSLKIQLFEKAHSLFSKLDTLSEIEEVKEAIKEADLSPTEINYINSSCFDGILATMNRGDKNRPDHGYCYASKTVPFFAEIVEKYPQYFETFKYYIVRGFVKEDEAFHTFSKTTIIAFLCNYYRTNMLEFIYERSKEISWEVPFELDAQKEFVINWTMEPEKSEKLEKIESYRELLMPKIQKTIVVTAKPMNIIRINAGMSNNDYWYE